MAARMPSASAASYAPLCNSSTIPTPTQDDYAPGNHGPTHWFITGLMSPGSISGLVGTSFPGTLAHGRKPGQRMAVAYRSDRHSERFIVPHPKDLRAMRRR